MYGCFSLVRPLSSIFGDFPSACEFREGCGCTCVGVVDITQIVRRDGGCGYVMNSRGIVKVRFTTL